MTVKLAFASLVLVGAMALSGVVGVPGAHAQPAKATQPRAETAQANAARLPAQTDGEYYARMGDCVACHTARGGEAFAGGLEMRTPFGTLYTPNITPDPETGIGKWTADDFWHALHDGRSRD